MTEPTPERKAAIIASLKAARLCPKCGGEDHGYERETSTLELRRCRNCGERFAITKEGPA